VPPSQCRERPELIKSTGDTQVSVKSKMGGWGIEIFCKSLHTKRGILKMTSLRGCCNLFLKYFRATTLTLPRQMTAAGPGKFPFAVLCSATNSAKSCIEYYEYIQDMDK
jgi:hypothetical protein